MLKKKKFIIFYKRKLLSSKKWELINNFFLFVSFWLQQNLSYLIDSSTSIAERRARRVLVNNVRNSTFCFFCVKNEYDCVVIVSNKQCVYCHSRAWILSTCEIDKKIRRSRNEASDIVEIIFNDEEDEKDKMKEIDFVDENVENFDFLDMKDFSKSTSKKSKIDV